MHRPLRTIAGLIIATAAVACSAVPPPGPTPPTAAPATAAPSGISLPPRPRDIPVDDIEPCSLLTAEQRGRLDLDDEAASSIDATQLFGSARSCDLGAFEPRAIAVGITLVTTTGIQRFTHGTLAAELTPITVGGFPALIARPTRLDNFCSVEIDIAAGQLVDVLFRDGGRKPPIPPDQLCRDAESVAAEVMTSLLRR